MGRPVKSGGGHGPLVGLFAIAAALAAFSCTNSLSETVKRDVVAYKEALDPALPRVTSFSVGPSIRYDFSIPLALDGTTDVAAWLVDESAAKPLAADPLWSAAKPTLYNASSGYGIKTLYAWAKSANGLVSDSRTAMVEIRSIAAPAIDSFTLANGGVTYDRTLGFTISATTAGEGAASITHYLVNESSTPPSAGDAGWLDFTSPESGTYLISLGIGAFGPATIYAWVKNDRDVVGNSASKGATYSEYGVPSIDTFSLTSSNPTDNTAISFTLSTTAYGNGSAQITGWLINESATPPPAASVNLPVAPTSFTVSATAGVHTVYAWAKNEHGKVSAGKTISVTINVPSGTWSAPYVAGYEIAAHEGLTLVSGVNLSSSLSGSGIGTCQCTLGGDNRTITIKPGASGTGLWTAGAGTLTVSGTTVYGVPFSKSIALNVWNGVCVGATGLDTNAGTTTSPYLTISYGISKAKTAYKDQGRPSSEVRVALGSYTTNWASATNQIIVQEGISLLGGFPTSFQSSGRSLDVSDATTLSGLADSSATGGATFFAANRAIDVDTEGVTRATVIEGFSITSGGGAYSVGIHAYDATSNASYIAPTIRKNRIAIGGSATTSSAAIYSYAALPLIDANWINGASPSFSGNSALALNAGLYLWQCGTDGSNTATVRGNTVWGPTAQTDSQAIVADVKSGTSISIEKNEIRSGQSTNPSGIVTSGGGTINIHNNLVFAGYATATGGVPKLLNLTDISTILNVRNNTLLFGTSSSTSPNNSYGVYFAAPDSSALVFQNNIFRIDLGPYFPGISYCFYEAAAVNPTIGSNLWYDASSGTAYVYHDSTLANYSTIATLQASGAATASGNITGDPLLNALSFKLQASSPSGARTGGIDGGAIPWPFADDKDGAPRPSGSWSMGCYQY